MAGMLRKIVPFVFAMAAAACAPKESSVAGAPATAVAELASPATGDNPLLNRVWIRADANLPGVMRIFLADGTLVMDSCWETYRLSQWQSVSPTAISWREDTAEIRADIVDVTDQVLVLKLNLVSGIQEEHYLAGSVPYVCPDMPK
jgi:hypothetical protein